MKNKKIIYRSESTVTYVREPVDDEQIVRLERAGYEVEVLDVIDPAEGEPQSLQMQILSCAEKIGRFPKGSRKIH